MPTLNLSDAELRVVRAALNTYIRVELGRPDQAFEEIVSSGGVRSDGKEIDIGLVRAALLDVAEALTSQRYGGPGIFTPRVSNRARLAYKVVARLDGDTLREGMVDNDGNPPTR